MEKQLSKRKISCTWKDSKSTKTGKSFEKRRKMCYLGDTTVDPHFVAVMTIRLAVQFFILTTLLITIFWFSSVTCRTHL